SRASAPSRAQNPNRTINPPTSWHAIVAASISDGAGRPRAATSALPPAGSSSFDSPLQRNTTLRQTRARRLPYSILACLSEGPAGAAEGAPEALRVGNRQLGGPGICVRMAVNAATARGIGGSESMSVPGTLMIAAEAAHRRPVGHGRRQRGRQILE